MLSLHKTTSEIRLLGKWLVILVGILIIALILFRVGNIVKEIISPTPPPAPEVTFGKLPPISFPPSLDNSNNTYTLNTISGTLPSFSDRVKVFKTSIESPNLLALQRARERIAKVGFSGSGYSISPTIYQWNEEISPYKKLVLDILNYNFNITSSYLISNESGTIQAPTEPEAIKKAEDFLSSLATVPPDINIEKTKTTLYTVQGNDLVLATSLATANIVRVDFYQKDLDSLNIFYPNPPFSSMNFLVEKKQFQPQIVEAHYFHLRISDDSATYPIITANEAWEKLKKGEAIITSYSGESKNISIRNVSLGYYAGDQQQDYVMPVILFEGDDNFYAFVSAVRKEWIQDTNK